MELIIAVLGSVAILAVSLGIVAYKKVTMGFLDPKITNKRIKYLNDYIDEVEYDNKKLKGMVSNWKRTPQIAVDDSILSDADGVAQLVRQLLPQVAPMLPKPLQALANDPKAVDFAVDLYKKDPEKAKSLLSSFIKKGKGGKSEIGQGMVGVDAIPEFGKGGIL